MFKIKGIASFPHVFQPRAVNPGDDPKYSVSILVKKDDPQMQQVWQAIETEKANGFPSGFPANGRLFVKDGAENTEDPRMANYYIIAANAKADQKPVVVDTALQPVTDASDVYPGAIVWASLNAFSYNKPINKGIGCGLNGLMVTGEEGELGRLDNRPSAEQMFEGVTATAPQGAVMPPQPAVAAPQAPQPAAPAPAAPQASQPAAPVAPAPQPPQPPQPPAQAAYTMTAAANGATREQYHAAGWTDEQLIQQGLMLPPGGVNPAFS